MLTILVSKADKERRAQDNADGITARLHNTSQAVSTEQKSTGERSLFCKKNFKSRRVAQRKYLKVSPFQMQKFSPSDVMTDEDFFVLSQIEQIQPSSNFLCAPFLNYQS